jgi:hypothetical protein
MNATRTFVVSALAFVLSTQTLQSQHQGQYRDFTLGSTVSSIASLVQLGASDATVLHQRPALLQALQWRTPYFSAGSSEARHDPVQQIVFSFYNDQLFRLARMADAQAMCFDERAAPSREIARQKKAADDARVLQEKARVANKV